MKDENKTYAERGILHELIQSKLRALAELDDEMHRIREEMDDLSAFLLETAPMELRVMLEEGGIVSDLITHGSAFFRMTSLSDYGFDWPADVFAAIKELKKAWRGVVTIKVLNNCTKVIAGERFEVSFIAYDPLR